MTDLSRRLAKARADSDRSAESVAAAAGISGPYLAKLEAGEIKSPSPHILRALAAVLDLDHQELVDLSGPLPAVDGAEGPPSAGVDRVRIAAAVREILEAVGEDPDREGLLGTPDRVARLYEELFAGLRDSPDQHLQVTFGADYDEMIMVRDIPLYSLCEHHLVPFFGRAHVAYIPGSDGRVTGLSKLPRLVGSFARRPQVQEQLTNQIAEEIDRGLSPRGVLVVIEAEHLCMSMRGVRQPGTTTITSSVRGLFRSNAATRAEAMAFLHRS